MYSSSNTPERCVRVALDEQVTASFESAAMQYGPASKSSARRSVSAANGFTSEFLRKHRQQRACERAISRGFN